MTEHIKVHQASDLRAKFLGVISYRGNTRLRMSILLMGADMTCFLLAGFLAIGVRPIFNAPLRFELFQQTLPILIMSLISLIHLMERIPARKYKSQRSMARQVAERK